MAFIGVTFLVYKQKICLSMLGQMFQGSLFEIVQKAHTHQLKK